MLLYVLCEPWHNSGGTVVLFLKLLAIKATKRDLQSFDTERTLYSGMILVALYRSSHHEKSRTVIRLDSHRKFSAQSTVWAS
jgi:hypothetical protein